MDTLSAWAMGAANRGKELMVFDWNKAAKLIVEKKAKNASAGLSGDWEWTGGRIFEDGNIVKDGGAYLASTWATPELEIDGETFDCYKMQGETPGWDSDTCWPEEARQIIAELQEIVGQIDGKKEAD